MTQHLGIDVLELEPDGGDGRGDEAERRFYLLDGDTGKVEIDDPDRVTGLIREFAWVCTSRAAEAELRAFLDARRGRAVPFWLPSLAHDLTLNGDHNSAHTFIDVKKIGYATFMWPDTGARRHLFFRHRTGTYLYRKAMSAVDNQNGTESIYLDSALGQDVPVEGWAVGFLRLCRLEDDLAEIEYHGPVTRARLRLRELPHEAPL